MSTREMLVFPKYEALITGVACAEIGKRYVWLTLVDGQRGPIKVKYLPDDRETWTAFTLARELTNQIERDRASLAKVQS